MSHCSRFGAPLSSHHHHLHLLSAVFPILHHSSLHDHRHHDPRYHDHVNRMHHSSFSSSSSFFINHCHQHLILYYILIFLNKFIINCMFVIYLPFHYPPFLPTGRMLNKVLCKKNPLSDLQNGWSLRRARLKRLPKCQIRTLPLHFW